MCFVGGGERKGGWGSLESVAIAVEGREAATLELGNTATKWRFFKFVEAEKVFLSSTMYGLHKKPPSALELVFKPRSIPII